MYRGTDETEFNFGSISRKNSPLTFEVMLVVLVLVVDTLGGCRLSPLQLGMFFLSSGVRYCVTIEVPCCDMNIVGGVYMGFL